MNMAKILIAKQAQTALFYFDIPQHVEYYQQDKNTYL